MADTVGKPEWKIDMTDWIARQTVEETQTKDWQGKDLKLTRYGDFAGMMARHIIESKFQDYLYPGPGRKVTANDAETGATASYSPFSGKINPPKSSPATLRETADGKQDFVNYGYKGNSSDEVFDTVFTMLHELTHARNPAARNPESWALGAPSQQAVTELVKAAVATGKFPSQGKSGDIEELIASLSVVRDMNAAGISGMSSTAGHQVQKGYDELNKTFPWMQEYLTAQSLPERKFYSSSPKITESKPALSEIVTAKLKSLFGMKVEK